MMSLRLRGALGSIRCSVEEDMEVGVDSEVAEEALETEEVTVEDSEAVPQVEEDIEGHGVVAMEDLEEEEVVEGLEEGTEDLAEEVLVEEEDPALDQEDQVSEVEIIWAEAPIKCLCCFICLYV